MFAVLFNKKKSWLYCCASLLFLGSVVSSITFFMNEFLPSFAAFYNAIYPVNVRVLSIIETVLFALLSEIVLSSYEKGLLIKDLPKREKTLRICIRAVWIVLGFASLLYPSVLVAACLLFIISICIAIYHHKDSFFPLWLMIVCLIIYISEIIPGFMPLYDFENGGISKAFSLSILQRGINVELASLIIVITGVSVIIKEIKSIMNTGEAMKISHRNFNRICLSYNLTEREIEIAKLVCRGLNNSEISKQLFISVGTVKVHIHHIFMKFGINSRVQLLAKIMNIELEEEQ